MNNTDMLGILDFLRHAEQLKNTLRNAHTSNGRQESTAEHTWRLCLMVMMFEKELPEIDHGRLMKMCVIHDLGEAISGDIAAIHQDPNVDKSQQEREDLLTLMQPLPSSLQDTILELWDEYEQAATPEAKIAKGLDKLETMIQHNQGQNPSDFNYGFNLTYGKQYTDQSPLLAAIRALVDQDTEYHHAEQQRAVGS
ncbi:HD domain-containing protein [Photobacterium sanctipauli]|uniref:HD domain-containing protein n=1 Tax=Photobacterium sanctipauli TaxID=1342794 RepID=A0A2T3NBN5_9GAMM|nr:HD domain-containing protein [Photobacterium sanctipauli]PSW11377.1 HD domain-containing protein [Photobacterium sanctipauli]